MGDRKIPHVEQIFGGGEAKRPMNILDRKTSFNAFKSKRAPEPPGNLPKIGNYQPKMLLQPKSPTGNATQGVNNVRTFDRRDNSPSSADKLSRSPPRAMVIGDKDVPLRIEHDTDNDNDSSFPVAPPRRKRRAPSCPDESDIETLGSRNNPLFERSVSQRSDEEVFGMEEQGGDIDFGSGIDNPAFNTRSRTTSGSSYQNSRDFRSSHDASRDHSHSHGRMSSSEHIVQAHVHAEIGNSERERRSSADRRFSHVKTPDNIVGNKDLPYIPPPDYYDEEVTMDFEEERDAFMADNMLQRRRHQSDNKDFRHLEGEDFGRYLDDDYEFDRPRQPPPQGYRKQHKSHSMPRESRPKPPKDNKKKSKGEQTKRNTIRDFTFSDSKIGWGDRTVKSTSAKGRYIKREKDRKRIDTSGPQNGSAVAQGSYEEFLRVRNGILPESPNSSDSGVELGEERAHSDMYIHSQPKQMRYRKYEEKPNMWQRLTWRFRKNVNISRRENHREPEILSERL
ncbi:uncharacterized protein LOC128215548 [Mya arenaria]|uniref:uncharacterized protein LOC128215548 n=1 Tax=Mya arenaria TaxID=6604 RepID=UPI0022E820D2|nr:uncharacterized protein LOC128215548 [Mya arenaria]